MSPKPSDRLAARLGAIVLIFESIVTFLGGLVVYGLDGLPWGLPAWWGVVGGGVLAVLLIVAAGVTRFRWGIQLGWFLQIVLAIAGIIFVPAFLLAVLVFGGMWAYVMITSARIAREGRAAAEPTESE